MNTKRVDSDHITEIAIWNDGAIPAYQPYRITCMDADYDTATDRRTPPTARISLLCATSADVASTRRIAAEYAHVADVAEALQTEKRAAYAAQYGED